MNKLIESLLVQHGSVNLTGRSLSVLGAELDGTVKDRDMYLGLAVRFRDALVAARCTTQSLETRGIIDAALVGEKCGRCMRDLLPELTERGTCRACEFTDMRSEARMGGLANPGPGESGEDAGGK